MLARLAVVLLVLAGLAILFVLLRPAPAPQVRTVVCEEAAGEAPRLRLEPILSGFEVPTSVVSAYDGSGRLFVTEKGGSVWIVEDGEVQGERFLDLRDRVTTDGEEGLLDLAFHPNYLANGRFFAFYSSTGAPRSVVAEFRASGNQADPEGRVLLEIPQDGASPLHKGGQLQFGPDGYLYISVGDGGTGPEDAQDLGNLRGVVLRIDVDGVEPYGVPRDNPFVGPDGAQGEIWAYGFRNPWRFSIDYCTGRVFVADVGEARFEEIDLVEAGGNYGWPVMEASHCLDETVRQCGAYRFEPPIYEYAHLSIDPDGGNSIIGGYVYRGGLLPELLGRYLFADFTSGRVWTLTETEGEDSAGRYLYWNGEEVFQDDQRFTSFGEGEDGELYLVSAPSGILSRIVVEEPLVEE
jgi:glucose/arabinose dehydrogenase